MATKQKVKPPDSPIQQNVYTVGCTLESMHATLSRQLKMAGVPNASEVALDTIKQGYNNAVLSIQTSNAIQTHKQPALVGFNRG